MTETGLEPLEGKALQATAVPPGCVMVMFEGSVRSSKTVSSLLMWLRYVQSGPPGMLAIVGRTETTAINNVVLPLQEWLGTGRVVLNRGLGIVTILGRVHRIFGANDAAAYTKVQGMTLAGAYVDEGATIHQTFYNMLRSRLSVPGAMLFLTCNPENPKHWLKVNWLDKAEWHLDRDGVLHHYEEWDELGNPKHLPIWRVTFLLRDNAFLVRHNPGFIRQLETSWPRGGVFHRRYINSEWVSAEGTVYSMWDEARMTVNSAVLPRVDKVLHVGVDYGTTHPTRGYLIGMVYVTMNPDGSPRWGEPVTPGHGVAVLVVLSEFAPGTGTVGQHAAEFDAWMMRNASWGRHEWVAVDPAAATFRAELFARGRNDVMRAHNAVVPGIQTVQSLLQAGRLFILRDRCPELVRTIDAYEWDTKATEHGETRPIKEHDDEVDALRYAIYTSRSYWRDHIALAPLATDDYAQEDAA